LRNALAHIPEPLIPKKGVSLAQHEIFLIKEFVFFYQKLANIAWDCYWTLCFKPPDLSGLFEELDPEGSKLPAFRLGPAFSAKLATLIATKQDTVLKLKHARHQALETAKQELGMPNLKEEFVLSRNQMDLLQSVQSSGRFVLTSENVANCGFRLADDASCLAIKAELSDIDEKLEQEENIVLEKLSLSIQKAIPLLTIAKRAVADIGWTAMLADFGFKYQCCIPSFADKALIHLKQARNLPLELHLKAEKRPYQALDLTFTDSINLITGPNMGGKTSILKTLGQMALLLRHGIPLPCEKAKLPFFEQVWFNHDSGSGDGDLSSFGKEVVSFSTAQLHKGFDLWLLDEFAKGTNPAEGEAIASAVLKHLSKREGMCVAATHFSAPAMIREFAQFSIAGLDLIAMNPMTDLSPAKRLKLLSEHMDYRLLRLRNHQAPPQCAVAVARVLGMPEEILDLIDGED
ncbi:MAG: hypothetical protein U1B83_01205, partial [Candidatus Cloacimonadaceae bacterium]|nr:hypothetical protein [Candidatus Cloacimonadaceae bacterium]